MQTMIRKPCLVSIVPLLALFALTPAISAQEAAAVGLEPERSFALDLAAAVEADDLVSPAAEQTVGVEREVHLAALEAFTDPNAWRATHASDASLQQTQSTKSGGGFGRWLKKRWYIPVIAAVVIGVTIADDDDAGEEDDD